MFRNIAHSYFHRKMCSNTCRCTTPEYPFESKESIPDMAIMLLGQSSNRSQHHIMTRALEFTEKADKVSRDRCPRYLPVGKQQQRMAMHILHPSECLQQKWCTDLPAAFLIMSFKELLLLFLE